VEGGVEHTLELEREHQMVTPILFFSVKAAYLQTLLCERQTVAAAAASSGADSCVYTASPSSSFTRHGTSFANCDIFTRAMLMFHHWQVCNVMSATHCMHRVPLELALPCAFSHHFCAVSVVHRLYKS
jgi:hypothetical protein